MIDMNPNTEKYYKSAKLKKNTSYSLAGILLLTTIFCGINGKNSFKESLNHSSGEKIAKTLDNIQTTKNRISVVEQAINYFPKKWEFTYQDSSTNNLKEKLSKLEKMPEIEQAKESLNKKELELKSNKEYLEYNKYRTKQIYFMAGCIISGIFMLFSYARGRAYKELQNHYKELNRQKQEVEKIKQTKN